MVELTTEQAEETVAKVLHNHGVHEPLATDTAAAWGAAVVHALQQQHGETEWGVVNDNNSGYSLAPSEEAARSAAARISMEGHPVHAASRRVLPRIVGNWVR